MIIPDLPCDIESEILCRIPTKSLAKLQTVCKRWNALFNDPDFFKKKFGKSSREVLVLKDTKVYSVNINLLDQSIEFKGKLSTIKDSEDVKISEIFHCKGLLLCTMSETENTRLVVWNPCTGQTTRIKRTCYKEYDQFALGYVNSCHSYKILKFSLYSFNIDLELNVLGEFEMYEFSSESWRVLDNVTPNANLLSSGVSLKGNTYWLALDALDHKTKFILSFDFTTERFGHVSLPFQNYDSEVLSVVREEQLSVLRHKTLDDYALEVLSVVREEQLSVLRHKTLDDYALEVQIWVTNNIDEANEVLWSIVVDFGKVTIRNVEEVVSLLDGDNKVAICSSEGLNFEKEKWMAGIHFFGEDIDKQVYEEIFEDGAYTTTGPFFLNYYVPSLVRI